MNILQVNSSARSWNNGQGSQSTRLANELVAGLRATHPDATLTVRNLTANPHPVLDEATLGALFTPAAQRTPYLRTMLGFLGMTDVDFIYAEGLALGPDAEARALESARNEIARIAGDTVAA